VNRCRELELDCGQLRAFIEATVTNDAHGFRDLHKPKSLAAAEARGRKRLQTRSAIENEVPQGIVSHETSLTENRDVLTNTKDLRKALILNKLATVSTKQTIVFHTKVGVVGH
jgi:hypothetical protein